MIIDVASELVNRLRREADLARTRTRNGIRLAGGRQPPRSGQTAKEVVWSREKVQLWHYSARLPVAGAGPVLLVHSLVSRSYIFDLQPGSSLVEDLTSAGLDVYLLDWGVPDEHDAANTIETYVDELIPAAVEVVKQRSRRLPNMIGYCLGGILSVLYAARRPDLSIATLTTLAAPIDFADLGMVVAMLREGRLEVDDLVDDTGNIPPGVFRQAFRMMQPTAEITQYVNLLQNLSNNRYIDSHQVMSRWVADHVPFPGGVARQATDLLIRQNSLHRGELLLGGQTIDLGAISCPVLCVVAERDHIVPITAAEPLMRWITSPGSRQLRLPAGHVALVMGRTAKTVTVPAILDHILAHSEGSAVIGK